MDGRMSASKLIIEHIPLAVSHKEVPQKDRDKEREGVAPTDFYSLMTEIYGSFLWLWKVDCIETDIWVLVCRTWIDEGALMQ